MNKQVKTIQGATMNDLGLSLNMQKTLVAHSPEEIVTAARNGKLTDFDGIGEIRAAMVTQKLAAAGFIFSESARSEATRRLLAVICVIPNYNSVEEYEARQEFSAEQIDYVRHILVAGLTPREARVIVARFGLDGGSPVDLETCGRQENVTRERIRQIEAKALNKLRRSERTREILQHFPEFVGEQKLGPVVSALECYHEVLSPEFQDIIAGKLDSSTSQMPVESLKLPKRPYGCLRMAGIHSVGQLLRMTELQLQRVRNLGYNSAMEVVTKLHQLDLSLAQSAESASSI